MKKIITLFAVVLLAFSFSSCRKYCKCTGYVAGMEGETYKVELNEEEASSCEELSTAQDVQGTKIGIECK